MKARIAIESDKVEKVRLIELLAKEMGLTVHNEDTETDIHLVSEAVLAEDWLSEEDERWDEIEIKPRS
jgi:hypothetical protein